MKDPINIMLVEDSAAFRKVISRTLGSEPGFTLISQFGTAEIALRSLKKAPDHATPDLVLLDLNLPEMSGLEALSWIREYVPNTKIIILTQSNQEADIVQAISQGASGYLLKSNSLDQLTAGIRNVMNGGASLDPTVAKFLTDKVKQDHSAASQENPLSPREIEVLLFISEGLQKKEIGDRLNISPRTVAAHVEKIYDKLKVHNAPSAVNKAHQLRIFPTED
jgi:two-component system nitrate/nitrite response regulator NarL